MLLLVPAAVIYLGVLLATPAQQPPKLAVSFDAILPDALGDYIGGAVSHDLRAIKSLDLPLLREYGLREGIRRIYLKPKSHAMIADVFRFTNSEGGHAAYLSLFPAVTVDAHWDGLWSVTYLLNTRVGSGVTIVGWRNYVLRFIGASPPKDQLVVILEQLPALDPSEPTRSEFAPSSIHESERILLGPVSLLRFAHKVPPSVAALNGDASGRVSRVETPAGTIRLLVFDYPSATVARERFKAFKALSGAYVKMSDTRVGVIFNPPDSQEADQLLKVIDEDSATERYVVGWDSSDMMDEVVRLDGGMAVMLFGGAIGGMFAMLRYVVRRRVGFSDRTIRLNILSTSAADVL